MLLDCTLGYRKVLRKHAVGMAPDTKKGGFGRTLEGVFVNLARPAFTSFTGTSDQSLPNPSCDRCYARRATHTRGISGVSRPSFAAVHACVHAPLARHRTRQPRTRRHRPRSVPRVVRTRFFRRR